MTSNSQSTKSLGQVNREAHQAHVAKVYAETPGYGPESVEALPFDLNEQTEAAAWQAAAEAVIGSVDVRPDVAFTRGFKKGREETEARYRAVIEAAKAVEHEAPIPLGAPPTVLFLDALAKLHVAVEALQEVEGG